MDEERIILRISTNGSDREVISILLEDRPEALPFNLHPLVHWPKGVRACSERAMLLMRAGLLYLSQQSPSSVSNNSTAAQDSEQAKSLHKKAVDIRPELVTSQPTEVARMEKSPKFAKPDFDISLFQ